MTPRKRTPAKRPAAPVSAPPVVDGVQPRWSAEEPLIFRRLVEERGGFPTPPRFSDQGGN